MFSLKNQIITISGVVGRTVSVSWFFLLLPLLSPAPLSFLTSFLPLSFLTSFLSFLLLESV